MLQKILFKNKLWIYVEFQASNAFQGYKKMASEFFAETPGRGTKMTHLQIFLHCVCVPGFTLSKKRETAKLFFKGGGF
jgi:hypothetical protein